MKMNSLQLSFMIGLTALVILTLVVYYRFGPFGPKDINQRKE